MNKTIIFFIIFILVFIIYWNFNNIRINILVFLILNRGLLAPNCFWWKISDTFLQDSSGVKLYYNLKQNYGNMIPINIFGTPMYMVTDVNYIRQMLNHSPDTFCVGKFKYNFFKPFMELNVGVSKGCPWKKRRILNQEVLFTNYLHIYADHYNNIIKNLLQNHQPKNFNKFMNTSQYFVSPVVFNKKKIPDDIFKIFQLANSLQAVINPNFKLPNKINNFYRKFIWNELQNPQPFSLVSLCQNSNLYKEELIDQVPHWIFPIGGIIHTVVPRTLVMLCNHKRVFEKLLEQLRQINIDNAIEIYNLTYLKYCILETLRLNNLVTSTFRTLCQDFKFEDGRYFKKGTQFLILNNPVLRDPDIFKYPNKFIPERWNKNLENSYYNLTFNQGPQKCPGKDISLFLIESYIVHYLNYSGVLSRKKNLKSIKIDTNNIPQMINPCLIKFY